MDDQELTAREVGICILMLTLLVTFVIGSIWVDIQVHPLAAGGMYAGLGLVLILWGDKAVAWADKKADGKCTQD